MKYGSFLLAAASSLALASPLAQPVVQVSKDNRTVEAPPLVKPPANVYIEADLSATQAKSPGGKIAVVRWGYV